MARHTLLFASLLLAGLISPAVAVAADHADLLLRELRQAYGNPHWDRISGWRAEGRQISDELNGTWQATVNLRNGYYLTSTRNDMFTTMEGFDTQGHWRRDMS